MLKKAGLIASLSLIVAGCARTAPQTPATKAALESDAESALAVMKEQAPQLSQRLQEAHAYVVFPRVGKGGALVGGAFGRGIVYERGQPVGFAELQQASIGAQLGAQTFAEVILFRDRNALERFKEGGFQVTGTASAVFLRQGAANSIGFGRDGTAIVIMPRGGAMVDLSVAGQEIDYQPSQM